MFHTEQATVSCEVTPCSLVVGCRPFGWTCYLHICSSAIADMETTYRSAVSVNLFQIISPCIRTAHLTLWNFIYLFLQFYTHIYLQRFLYSSVSTTTELWFYVAFLAGSEVFLVSGKYRRPLGLTQRALQWKGRLFARYRTAGAFGWLLLLHGLRQYGTITPLVRTFLLPAP
jgi:hypothetical protein